MNHRVSHLSVYSESSSRTGFRNKEFGRDGFAPVHRAAAQNHHTRVKKFVITDPASKEMLTRDKQKMTPLLVAASYGSTESFQMLMSMGADIGARTAAGLSAVQCAATHRHTNLVLSIIDQQSLDIFDEIFTYLVTLPEMKELHNSMKVLDVVLGTRVTSNTDSEASKHYQQQIKDANGIQVTANVLEVCTRSQAMVTRIGPLGLLVIEKMATCSLLVEEIMDSSIPGSIAHMMQTNDECLESALRTVPLLAKSRADGCEVFIELDVPRIIMEAIKRSHDDSQQELVMECMYLLGGRKEVAEVYHKQGFLEEFINMMKTNLNHTVLILVLKTLEIMAESGAEIQTDIVEQGTMETLLQKLHYQSQKITTQVISLLKILCAERADAKVILKDSGRSLTRLIYVAKHSLNPDTQYQAVELLWMTAGKEDTERRALASLLGPSCILRILSLGKGDLRMTAITMLRLITPAVYGLQKDITSIGGVVSILKVIRIADSAVQEEALRALENLSCELAMRTNKSTQKSVLETDGIQLLLRLHSGIKDLGLKLQTYCTLAAVSIGNLKMKTMIINDRKFNLRELIESLDNPKMDKKMMSTAMRAICYLAYNCIEVQINICDAKKVPIEPFIRLLCSRDKYISTTAAFHLIVLTKVLDTSEDHTGITAESIHHLIKELERSITQEIIALQVHICALLSSLLHIRAGISSAFLASGIVSILMRLLRCEYEHCRRTAAITISYLTLSPQGSRKVLSYCRKTPRLLCLLKRYSEGYSLSKDFQDGWEHYKTTHLPAKSWGGKQSQTEIVSAALVEAKVFGSSCLKQEMVTIDDHGRTKSDSLPTIYTQRDSRSSTHAPVSNHDNLLAPPTKFSLSVSNRSSKPRLPSDLSRRTSILKPQTPVRLPSITNITSPIAAQL